MEWPLYNKNIKLQIATNFFFSKIAIMFLIKPIIDSIYVEGKINGCKSPEGD